MANNKMKEQVMINESAYVVHLNEAGIEYFYQTYPGMINPASLHDLYEKSKIAEAEAEAAATECENTTASVMVSKPKKKQEKCKKFSDIFLTSPTTVLTTTDKFMNSTIMAVYFENNSPRVTLIESQQTGDIWVNCHLEPSDTDIDFLEQVTESAAYFNDNKLTAITYHSASERALNKTGLYYPPVKKRTDNYTTFHYDGNKAFKYN